jgi:hypothetical protein
MFKDDKDGQLYKSLLSEISTTAIIDTDTLQLKTVTQSIEAV